MSKIIVLYYSKTGNTKLMAEYVAQGAKKAGAEVVLKAVQDAKVEEMLDADGIILGSPTYYGHSAGILRSFLDESVKLHGKLAGKVGGAFTSSANIGGGNETTVLDIIHALLIHGMIVKGEAKGDHYGPVAIGKPNEKVRERCVLQGKSIAELADKLV
jgi:NAD(P)H dehydrogenase (quinone)